MLDRRHSTHPADPCACAHGAIRVSLVSQRGGRTRMAGGHPGKGAVGRGDAGFGREGKSLGDRGLHLERVAGTRRGRGFAGHVSRRVQAGNGGPRRDARRHRGKSPRSLGRRTGQPRLARDRDPVFPRRSGTSTSRSRNTRNSSRGARVSKCSRRWTWRPHRRSTTPTITSAIATGSRSRSSKGAATNRRPAPARRSRQANSSSATRTKTGLPPTCRSRRCSRAMAASWLIDG